MNKHLLFSLLMAAFLAFQGTAFADLEGELNTQAIAAFKASDWGTLQSVGEQWIAAQERGEVPKTGPTFAGIAQVVGAGLFKAVREGSHAMSAEDFEKLVVNPLQERLKTFRKDFTKDAQTLANASKYLYEMQEPKSQDTENLAVWTMWRAVVESHKQAGFNRPVDQKTAALIGAYITFCIGMVETTAYPDLYRYRIRNACQLGFAAAPDWDDYFWKWYEKTFFDEGNIKAGVLFQNALDASQTNEETEEGISAVVKKFQQAIDATRTNKAKAEIYHQLAEFLNFYTEQRWLDLAYESSQAAYRLNPYERVIRDTYGSLLFRNGNAALNEKNYSKALQLGIDGTAFVHEKDYELYMILAIAQQFHGMALEAIKNAKTAYTKACGRAKTAGDLEYFASKYKEILENFGQGDKFRPCPGRSETKAQ